MKNLEGKKRSKGTKSQSIPAGKGKSQKMNAEDCLLALPDIIDAIAVKPAMLIR